MATTNRDNLEKQTEYDKTAQEYSCAVFVSYSDEVNSLRVTPLLIFPET